MQGVFDGCLVEPFDDREFRTCLLVAPQGLIDAGKAIVRVDSGRIQPGRLAQLGGRLFVLFLIRVNNPEIETRDAGCRAEAQRFLEQRLGCLRVVAAQRDVAEPRVALCVDRIMCQLEAEFALCLIVPMLLPQEVTQAEMDVRHGGRSRCGRLQFGTGLVLLPQPVLRLGNQHVHRGGVRPGARQCFEFLQRPVVVIRPEAARADRYLEVLGTNLDATLDLGQTRLSLRAVAKGLAAPASYFDLLKIWKDDLGSHRNSGRRRMTVLDDHDHVWGEKIRFSFAASNDHQVVAGVAIQLFSLGIPCVYYGTEQSLAGGENGEQQWLPAFGNNDAYLREAMFGPAHPRKSGLAGLAAGPAAEDPALPGFGPFGTSGAHCFDPRRGGLCANRRTHGGAACVSSAPLRTAIPTPDLEFRRAIRTAWSGRDHRLVAHSG